MRRKEKQIQELFTMESIIAKAEICFLAMSDNNIPYVVPLNFGYRDNVLYFHSAAEGKKLQLIKENPNVSFSMAIDSEIVKGDKACNWGMIYKSVIGRGIASFIEDQEAKIEALDIIMSQYSSETWEYKPKMLEKTVVVKIEVEELTGKHALD